MRTNSLAIGLASLRGQFDTSGSLDEVLLSAMRVARRYGSIWHTGDEDEKAMCAIGAVMAHFGEGSEEWERLGRSMAVLRALASGDFTALAAYAEDENAPEPLAIPKLWAEAGEGES